MELDVKEQLTQIVPNHTVKKTSGEEMEGPSEPIPVISKLRGKVAADE